MKKARVVKSAATLAGACVIAASLTGFASVDAAEVDAKDAVAAIQQVAPSAVSNVATTSSDAESAAQVTLPSGDAVSVPKDPTDGVQLTGAGDAPDLKIGLPFAEQAKNAAQSQEDGVVVYDNGNGSSTVPVARTDGSVQITTVIANADAPKRYDYPITVLEGQMLRLAYDGAALVGDEEGHLSLVIAAPWAKDARGNPVATHFEVDGNVLTQVLDFTEATAFPVVADPSVTWLWWGRTIKYNKAETKQVADFASSAQMFSYLCLAGGLAGAACTTAANLGFQIVKNAANNALRAGRCIQLNIPYVGLGLIYDVTC